MAVPADSQEADESQQPNNITTVVTSSVNATKKKVEKIVENKVYSDPVESIGQRSQPEVGQCKCHAVVNGRTGCTTQ